ncbi:MAG TPA: thioredoxin family protein [Nitrospiria bacterium]|nr:thioredoxin family protein [Nitrospiria bacterium]
MSLSLGSSIRPFQLKNVDGSAVSSDDLRKNAKAAAVVFWCNHCPYVQAWEERMVRLGNEYRDRGVAFVLINANDPKKYPEDDFSGMVKRSGEKGYPFAYLHDETQATARAYGATRTPEVFLFDSKGILGYHGRIDDNYEDPGAVRSHDLKDALEAVLAGKRSENPETPLVGCTIKWKPS